MSRVTSRRITRRNLAAPSGPAAGNGSGRPMVPSTAGASQPSAQAAAPPASDGSARVVPAPAAGLGDVVPKGVDTCGHAIVDVLWATPDFRIYKSKAGIRPHFSDDAAIAETQIQRYLALGAELAHVNQLINRLALHPLWQRILRGGDPRYCAFCEQEVARGVAQALVGEVKQGRATLAALTLRMEKRLLNIARVTYFAMCVLSAMMITLATLHFLDVSGVPIDWSELALVAVMGSVGALLSAAAGLRDLPLDARAMSLMNWIYGAQRMMVGVLGAIVLYFAIRAGFAPEFVPKSPVDPTDPTDPADPAGTYKLAFVSVLAGFSERLVPNLIDRNGGSGKPGPERESEGPKAK